MRRLVVATSVGLLALALTAPASASFKATIAKIRPEQRERMTGVSWHAGCPVPIRDLRVVVATRWTFDGEEQPGRLIVHEDVARGVVSVLRRLHEIRYPIRRMKLIDAYGGSDFDSIEADNTSAFNCRRATGSSNWSEHAYGRAIDLNPIENPYVEGSRVYHDASRRYVDRSKRLEGMIHAGDAVVRAFQSIGWGWGGYWSGSVKDYQHFSASGR